MSRKILRTLPVLLFTIAATTPAFAGEYPSCLPPDAAKIYIVHKRPAKQKWCKLPPAGVLLQSIPAILLPESGARVDARQMEAAFVGYRREELVRALAETMKKEAKPAPQPESEESKQAKIDNLRKQLGELAKAIEALQTQLDGLD